MQKIKRFFYMKLSSCKEKMGIIYTKEADS